MDRIEELTRLKEKRKDIWYKHGWSCKNFSNEEEAEDDNLGNKINLIESQGVYCKCSECGAKNDTVDFNSESPDKLMCLECWDELRDYIRDKCGI